jgi:hypothetical protein
MRRAKKSICGEENEKKNGLVVSRNWSVYGRWFMNGYQVGLENDETG